MIIFLKFYKNTLSKYLYVVFGAGCKYEKTCSEFAIEAIEKRGILKGTKISIKRLLSCQPFSKKYYANPSDIE